MNRKSKRSGIVAPIQLPERTLRWHGPSLVREMDAQVIALAQIAALFGRHTQSIYRWTLPSEHSGSARPSVDLAHDLAAILRVPLARLMIEVDARTGDPVPAETPAPKRKK